MISQHSFDLLLIGMSIIAVIVFIVLQFISPGYGMMYNKKWGASLNNRLGWVLMECPVFIAMGLLWWFSDRKFETVPLVIFCLFQLHYFQRSFIFPMLIKGKNRMPLVIIGSGFVFNLLNAFMQGGWLFYLAPSNMYNITWLYSPQFIIGLIIFLGGMAININSDYIIRHLRKPGDTRHYIPRGGMFRYVSSANYFGEFIEWCGFAILTWSCSGAVFALWTFANLSPRASKIQQRYKEEFGKEFTELQLRRILPFIY